MIWKIREIRDNRGRKIRKITWRIRELREKRDDKVMKRKGKRRENKEEQKYLQVLKCFYIGTSEVVGE